MSKAKFNEDGILVNSETGEAIGTKSGNRTTISSRDSMTTFSLDDYGVREPDFPDEEDSHSGRKDEDEDFSAVQSVPVGQGVPMNSVADKKQESHLDSGPTSFNSQRTKYEISKDSFFVVRFGLMRNDDDGRFIPIKDEEVDGIPQSERHWVKFRMWNYGEELRWKSECLEYSNVSKSQFMNVDKLNEMKLRNLMLDWSFGEYEDRLKLLHCDGRLSDESYSLFMGMYPSIANTIVNLMNLVLENNQ